MHERSVSRLVSFSFCINKQLNVFLCFFLCLSLCFTRSLSLSTSQLLFTLFFISVRVLFLSHTHGASAHRQRQSGKNNLPIKCTSQRDQDMQSCFFFLRLFLPINFTAKGCCTRLQATARGQVTQALNVSDLTCRLDIITSTLM